MTSIDHVAVIGLDCADPSLIFERWRDDLPVLSGLRERGMYGPLTSCIPPITVPAWSCMAASKDPGTLGIYGFRNRKDRTYEGLSIATSLAVKHARLWDLVSAAGRDSIVVGVPGTYPIVRPPKGAMISGFLTPDTTCDFTSPPGLKADIASWVGEYKFDAEDFRTDDKAALLQRIYTMTDRRFDVLEQLTRVIPWSLLWMVEMGVDRIHHAFWQFMDPAHHRYEAGNAFENAIRDYYIHVDQRIGRLLEGMDLERTAVWVVSDHGAKCMTGGFLLNEWLIQQGYLVLKERPEGPVRLTPDLVDWPRTRAWGDGGYYGRCFINVQGREPHGVVRPDEYESFRDKVKGEIEAIADPDGASMGNVAHRPEDLYVQVNGVAPDLVIILGDLSWRSVGQVGADSVYTFDNDTGPDGANHAQDGMFIAAHASMPQGVKSGVTLYDVAPTILQQLNLAVPGDMRGRSLA
jgi:predicted AlkP superfamily phosphohydrolase/phosphomutase